MAEVKQRGRRLRGGSHTCVYLREDDWEIIDSVRQGIHGGQLKHRSVSDFVQEAIHLLAKTYKIN